MTVGRPTLFQTDTEWGTPWPRAKSRGTAEGGGITRPYLFEMTRPGDSESKKRFHHHSLAPQ